MDPALKYLYHRFIDSPDRWYPFLAVYYLTYRCDFRCPYCSNGFNTPYYKLSGEILPAGKVLEILGRIRSRCDYLVITGGEPLQHPEFARIIKSANELRFRELALNTNGFDVNKYLLEISASVHTLIFSLDTMDSSKADEWFGKGPGVFERIVSNISSAAQYPGRKYRIIISSLITPGNIPDAYQVYDFAQRNGFQFAACPELRGVKAHQELLENTEYRRFFNFLISEKKKGRNVFGTSRYLQYMRDLKKFSCRPFTMLVVDPMGQVFYPCLEIGHFAGNIMESADLRQLRKRGLEQFGPKPDCGVQCHSACALGFSLIFEYPFSIIEEAAHYVKTFCHKRKNGKKN